MTPSRLQPGFQDFLAPHPTRCFGVEMWMGRDLPFASVPWYTRPRTGQVGHDKSRSSGGDAIRSKAKDPWEGWGALPQARFLRVPPSLYCTTGQWLLSLLFLLWSLLPLLMFAMSKAAWLHLPIL